MKPTSIALFAAVLLGTTASSVSAQKFQPKSIQFKGADGYTDQEMMTAAGLQKGVVLNYAEMNDHSKRLMDSGMFAGLAFKFDGQDLIFTVTPSTDLFPIRLANFPMEPGKELDEKLHKLFPLYHGRVPGEDGLREDVRQALEAMLAANGMTATVEASNIADPLHKTKVGTVEYRISSPAVQMDVVAFNGVSDLMRGRVNHLVQNASRTPFLSQKTAADLERSISLQYEDANYAAAEVHVQHQGQAQVRDGKILIPFALSVNEGKSWQLGRVDLPPGSLFSAADADKVLHGQRAGEALTPTAGSQSASLAVVSNSVRMRSLLGEIVSTYKSKGYLDCTATPHPSYEDATGVVNYSISIEPGAVYHLGFVKFDNVTDDLRRVLIRNWQMLPGDPFDPQYVGNFIKTLREKEPTLARTLNGVKTSFDVTADPVTHDVNVVLRLERAAPAN